MIYIIDSCYAANHKEECIIIKNTNLMIEEMTSLVGALGNLYSWSKKCTYCPPKKLFEILCEKFECKDRKHKYTGELEFIERRIQSPMLYTTFLLYDELIIWIDIKEAIGYTAGRVWNVLNQYLSKEELDEIKFKWES